MSSRQSLTLARHIRHALPDADAKNLWDDVVREYVRTTYDPKPNVIGMLLAMSAECLVTWSAQEASGLRPSGERGARG